LRTATWEQWRGKFAQAAQIGNYSNAMQRTQKRHPRKSGTQLFDASVTWASSRLHRALVASRRWGNDRNLRLSELAKHEIVFADNGENQPRELLALIRRAALPYVRRERRGKINKEACNEISWFNFAQHQRRHSG
jgi:hypothetical protein